MQTISIPERQVLYEMTVQETLDVSFTRNILTCLLNDYRYGRMERPEVQKYFDIYDVCVKFQRKLPKPFGKKQLSEFEQLGLDPNMIRYLNDGVMSGNRKHIYESIIYIKDSMADFIENTDEFIEYKKSILQKVNEVHKKHEEPLVRVAAVGRGRSGQNSNMKLPTFWQLPRLLVFLLTIFLLY